MLFFRKQSGVVLAGVFAISILTQAAMAADGNGWIVGASVGVSNFEYDVGRCENAMPSGALSWSCTSKNSDFGYKLTAGYRFAPAFSLEGAYLNFGKLEINGTSSIPSATEIHGETRASGFDLMAVGHYAVNDRLSVFGNLGFIVANATASEALTGVQRSVSESSATPAFGIGGAYNLTRYLSIRFEWERFKSIGDEQKTHTNDIDLPSLGVMYTFK